MAVLGLFLGLLGGAFLLKLWVNFDDVFQTGNILFIAAAFLWAVLSKITSFSKAYAHPITFSFWIHVVVPIGMFPFINFNPPVCLKGLLISLIIL